jgi:hypothetical protein
VTGGGSAGGNFSLARDADSAGPGRLGGPPVRFLPPGAAPPESKTASKNARRRRKKTGGKGDADGDEGGQGDDDEGGEEGPVQATAAGGVQRKLYSDTMCSVDIRECVQRNHADSYRAYAVVCVKYNTLSNVDMFC